MNRRQALTGLAATAVATAFVGSQRAGADPGVTSGTDSTDSFPTTLALPNGWLPEGIAIGLLPFAYFGSRADGSIYRANLVTGEGRVISQGPGAGFPSVGLKVDLLGRLFVSGGSGGDARIVNALNGDLLATYSFHAPPTFINDVVLTPGAAYFTDSNNPFLYVLPLRFGQLPAADEVVHLPITGEIVFTPGFNINGIARTPDGTGLIIVQSSTGLLFRLDPKTGVTTGIDLGGELMTNGDGLLLHGRRLYVVQNRLNTLAVVRLNWAGTRGTVVARVTDPRFDVPTTVARYGDRLYLPNARFTTPPTPETPYTAVAIPVP